MESDPLGKILLERMDRDTLQLWLGDCQVPIGSIFDVLEDLDTEDMLKKLDEIREGVTPTSI